MKKKIIIFLLLVSGFFSAFGQGQRAITGKVLDAATREPLIGATIIIKGTSMGAITDASGAFKYTLSGSNIGNIVLEVSYVGYKSMSQKVGDRSSFEFLLEEDVNALEEVVVTSSYGTKKLKQEVVGSISNVRTKDMITEQPAVSFDELLEGQTAGVYVESGTEPGKPVNIHVRGQGSLTPLSSNTVGSSTQPLIIVDGIILAEEITLEGNSFFDAGDGKFSENLMNPLAKVGIKDIESINILKDAAAVSLYGADGANGVIVITTKGGQKGPLKYNFTAQGGFSTAINRIKYMNGEQFQEMRNLYYANSGQPGNVSEWNGVNTNWYDLLNRTGSFQNYDISVAGGSEALKFRVSLGYQNIQEPQINNDFVKYNGGISLRYEKKKFNASLKLSPSYTEKNTPNTLYSFAVPPTIPVYDSSGNYTRFDTYGNPLAVANQNRALVETKSLLTSINLSYDILENVQLSTLFGLDYSDKDQDTWYSGLNQTGQDRSGNIGERILRNRKSQRWNWNAKISWDKQFNTDHSMDALAGVETRGNATWFSYARGENFPVPDEILPIEDAEVQDYEEDRSENTGRSFFSQWNYDFRKKYFLLANFRIDQSSVFGTDNNTSYNGGLGASWVFSKESFMKNIDWIEFARLRLSYGTSGNSRIGSYRALGLYTFDDIGGDGYNQGDYANPASAPNPNLGWEKNFKSNFGLDITTSFRISASLEFFNDDIRDMIVSRSVLPETGFTSVQINGANMYNRGIEVSLRAHIIAKSKFKWITQFNYSIIKNEVTYLKGLGSSYSSSETARAQRVGYSTSVIWGYKYVGVDPSTGRELYLINENMIDGNYLGDHFRNSSFWEPIGNSQPDYFGGFNNQFRIGKNIEISMVMSYSYGEDVLIQKELLDQYRLLTNRNMSVNAYYNSWKQPGDIAYYPSIVNSNPLVSNSTKYLYSNSHIKLKSINFSYDIPVKNSRFFLDNLRVYANGSNLYYWFMDKSPEGQNGVAELRRIYPEMRTFSFGLTAGF